MDNGIPHIWSVELQTNFINWCRKDVAEYHSAYSFVDNQGNSYYWIADNYNRIIEVRKFGIDRENDRPYEAIAPLNISASDFYEISKENGYKRKW